MRTQKKNNWTVFFLIKSTGVLIEHVIDMINEIRCLELEDRLPIIFCINFDRENLDALLEGNKGKINRDRLPHKITTMFFSVVRDNDFSNLSTEDARKKMPNKLEIVSEDPRFDITKPANLENYFRNEVLLNFRAKHYLLI